MKQAPAKGPKRTPDTSTPGAIPAVVSLPGEDKHTRSRHHADAIAVGMLCRSRDGKVDPNIETPAQRDVWRRADDLAGPTPTPLIRSLALTVALCEVDIRYRQAINGPVSEFARLDHQSAFNGAMKRYLSACRTLAIAQRLDLPTVQVNIAEQQVVANG
jgi:hypothetical protein